MSKIDEEEAALALASLQLMGQAYDDELEAFWSSKIATDTSRRIMGVGDALRRRVSRSRRGARLGVADHRARRRRPLQADGGVRRAHAHDLPARDRAHPPGDRRVGARTGLPGLRHPDGSGRRRDRRRQDTWCRVHVVRRHGPCPGQQRQPPAGQGRGCRRALRVLTARRVADRDRDRPTARSCSSPSGSRRPRRRPRSRCSRPATAA